jgi:hypothetical protein
VLELGEHLLDRVEVWTVRGQEQEPCAVTANGGADCMTFAAAEIVDDDDVAGLERGEEELLDIEMEAFAIDRPIKLEPGYRSLIPTKPPGVRVYSASSRASCRNHSITDKSEPLCARPSPVARVSTVRRY